MKRLGACALLLTASVAFAEEAPDDRARLTALLEKSLAAYAAVNDYRAVFLKQELQNGALGGRETIFLKFEKPFKIFLHWSDTSKKGLQVLYERGRHDGKLAIHQPGLLFGLAPVVFLEQSSPWVREGSESYDIEDAGIGTFLEDFAAMVEKGIQENRIRARVTDSEEGAEVDVSFPGTSSGGDYFAGRVEAFFDAKTQLPVRMKLYDWQGNVTGIYAYTELALNIGADDAEFRRLAHKRLQKLYLPQVKITPRNNFSSRTN